MAADRDMQTRLFETDSELQLLNAGTGVLQDMGFVVDESETRLGLVTASKTVDATQSFLDQFDTHFVLAVLTLGWYGVFNSDDLEHPSKQTVRVNLTTSPSTTREGAFQARVVFDRTVISKTGVRMESGTIRSAEVYEAFFDALTKSVFLEAEHL